MENEELNFNEVNRDETNDIIEIKDFNFDGFQVVRGEFFAHLLEPSVTFNKCKLYVNMACLKKLPNIDFVQILVNSNDKKLAIRPCSGEEKDSFLWSTAQRKPKQISCKIFSAMIFSLMNWNLEYRYKLLGKLIKSNEEYLFIFDLNSSEMYERKIEEGSSKSVSSRTPIFPAEWKNQFGIPVAEHKKQLQINLFNDYAVFGLNDKAETNNDLNAQLAGDTKYE